MTDAVTITSKEELERWLSDKPREWAAAIAARAALRVVPALGSLEYTSLNFQSRVHRANFYVEVFRADFISQAFLVNKVLGKIDISTRVKHNPWQYTTLIHAVHTAAILSTQIACYDDDSFNISIWGAARNAASGIACAVAVAAEVSPAVIDDVRVLTANASLGNVAVATLMGMPLWPETGVPGWVSKHWAALRDDLDLKAAGFDVWFDWYEGLLPLNGSTPTDRFGPDLTRKIALQPNEWWDRGAEAVNADIVAWLAERDAVREVPAQQPADLQFRTAADWRIGVAPQDIGARDPAAAQAFLDELRERAADAARRLETARNAAPFLADEVARLCAFLPERAEDLNPYRLRNRLATIDAAVMTLQTAGPSRELSDDPVIQVTALALVGRELGLCFPDLRTRERDEIARSIPAGQERPIVEALAETPAAAAAAPDVVDAQAIEGLEIITTMARESLDGPPDAQRERIVEQVVVDRNFKSEAARLGWRLWDLLTGAAAGAGVRHALVFGYAALLSRLGSRELGAASVLSGHGQTDRALKLLEEQFSRHVKDLKDKPQDGR